MDCTGGLVFRRRADDFFRLALRSAARWMCACAMIAASLMLGGCKRNEYALELHEVPAGLDRKLTGEITQDEDRHRIAGLYEQDVQTVAEKTLDFHKVFSSKMPDDIGGVGTTTRWTSSLGSLSVYMERFRGNNDLSAAIERLEKGIDEAVDATIGWLSSELGQEAGFDRLREFLDKDIRRDLKNVAIYLYVGNFGEDWYDSGVDQFEDLDQNTKNTLTRLAQYLMERGYFTFEMLPVVQRAVERKQPLDLLRLAPLFIARLGLNDVGAETAYLDFFSDEERVATSFDRYVRSTTAFKNRLQKWEEERETNPEQAEPDPADVVGEMFLEAIDLKFVYEFDQLNVTLHCSTVPFLTNGEWSEISQLIVWEPTQLSVTPSLLQVPNVMYAAWSTPDKEFQITHFGKEFLAGRELAEYCIWHAGLVEEEAREWDAFLAGLTPQDGLISRINAFRFANLPNEETQSWAETPRKLLVAALRR